jgi:cobalt-zinc-cadmium efflux system membrane fusion protein
MHRQSSITSALVVTASLVLPCCGPTQAASTAQAEHGHDPANLTLFGERLLLFMEHPHLVRGESARFLAHLTVLETGEPVRSGSATLEIGATRIEATAPTRNGLFVPEGSVAEAGTFPARLVVRSAQAEETFDLGPLVVHADASGADRAAHESHANEPPGAVPFLMESQWKVRLLLAQAAPAVLRRRLTVPARALAIEGGSAIAAAPAAGRLVAAEGAGLARTGERVEQGAVLAWVEPLLGATELAQLRALELEVDLAELEALRTIAQAEARMRFAERERARIATLREEGLGTLPQLEAAEQDLALARAELDGARGMQASLERRRTEDGAGNGSVPLRMAVTAPIAGQVVEVRGVIGESVEVGAPLVRILDAARVWVEGRVSELDVPLLARTDGAAATFAALPGRSFEIGGAPFVGAEVDAASRTLAVRFELENPQGEVRPGMWGELALSTGEHGAAVTVPADAVLMEQGLPTAYVLLAGELFQRRELELGVRDGERVEVLQGIAPGERVATRGAWVVKLAALSPTSFGAGHAH